MTGVNDLAELWMSWDDVPRGEKLCAKHLQSIRSAVWRPVSEPPTEADGDFMGYVFFHVDGSESAHLVNVATIPTLAEADRFRLSRWARVSDVLLMPEGEGDG